MIRRESEHWDLLGRQSDEQRRERLAHAGLSFDPPGRELRLAVYDGDRKPWWVRIAADGALVSIVWTVAEAMPAGHWADPAEALKAACQGRIGFVEEVDHRTSVARHGPVGALGRIDGVPWEVELGASGLLRITGAATARADELAAASDLTEYLSGWDGLIALTETVSGGDGSPPLLPARGAEIPTGPPDPDFPERVAAPGHEILLTGHERAKTRWALRILADGRIAATDGGVEPWHRAQLKPDADLAAWAQEWATAGYPDFWYHEEEIIRWEIPAPPLPLTAGLGQAAVEVDAGGAVAVCGREARAVADTLVAAGFDANPVEAVRSLETSVSITFGKCITPYTSTL